MYKRVRSQEKELFMKAKVAGLPILAIHIMVLAGFSLMQGCKTAKVADVPQDQPVVLPADDLAGDKAPVLPPVSLPGPSSKTYSVQKGDTLSSIASAHGTTWKKLAELNNLSNPNQLKVGQEIRISESAGAASSSSASGKHAAASVSSRPIPGSIKQGSSYVIQKGDSLSSIAKRSGLTVSEIKAANSLSRDSLVVGKSLTIPKKGAVKAASVAKAAPAKAANPASAKAAVAPAALPAPAPLADAASTGSVAAVAPAAPAVPAAAAPVAKAAGAPVYEHVLYPGETLDDVARQYGSSQQEIMKLNNITDAASIKPGTKLLVPIPE